MDVDGVDVELLKQTFQAHESAGYWIHNRQIASRNDGWTRRTYSGLNTHEKHVHWNTRGAYENSPAPWLFPESEDDMDRLIQWQGGYWLCTARGRERIPDGATYTRYRALPWVQAYPGKDANGFAAPALEAQGWADWQVDDVFGPDTTIPKPVEVTLTPEQVAQVAEAARAGAEAGSPTDAELEAAAFAGAQRAEQE